MIAGVVMNTESEQRPSEFSLSQVNTADDASLPLSSSSLPSLSSSSSKPTEEHQHTRSNSDDNGYDANTHSTTPGQHRQLDQLKLALGIGLPLLVTRQDGPAASRKPVDSNGQPNQETLIPEGEILVTPSMTMTSLVIKYGVNAAKIRKVNRLWDDNDIHTMKTLKIPGLKRDVANTSPQRSNPVNISSDKGKEEEDQLDKEEESEEEKEKEDEEDEEEETRSPVRSLSYYDAIAAPLRSSQQQRLNSHQSLFEDL